MQDGQKWGAGGTGRASRRNERGKHDQGAGGVGGVGTVSELAVEMWVACTKIAQSVRKWACPSLANLPSPTLLCLAPNCHCLLEGFCFHCKLSTIDAGLVLGICQLSVELCTLLSPCTLCMFLSARPFAGKKECCITQIGHSIVCENCSKRVFPFGRLQTYA